MYAECACRYILVAVGKPPSHDCCFFFSSLLRSLCFLFSLAIRISEIVWEIASQLRVSESPSDTVRGECVAASGKRHWRPFRRRHRYDKGQSSNCKKVETIVGTTLPNIDIVSTRRRVRLGSREREPRVAIRKWRAGQGRW